MPQLHRYRIFISHAWKYNAEYYWLMDCTGSKSMRIFAD